MKKDEPFKNQSEGMKSFNMIAFDLDEEGESKIPWDCDRTNYVEMQTEAIEALHRIEYQLESKAEAAYELGMEGVGRTFYLLQGRLMDAIDLMKKANDMAFDEHVQSINQSAKNTFASALAIAKIAISTE